jgi:membrane-associated phospholipid phosphatase
MATDKTWYLRVNEWARDTPWLHGFMASYALWGGLVVLAGMLVGEWWRARHLADRAPAMVASTVLVGVASVVALLLNQQVVSVLIGRARPCAVLEHVEVLLPCSVDYSMPSDHCVIAGAFVAGLFVLDRAVGAVALVVALLLAFARVYAGVHYPADTVVGLLVGAVAALIMVLALRRPAGELAARLATTRWRSLVTTK